MANGKGASKHEYGKPALKQQIDAAMKAFLQQGRAVQRVPPIVVQEPPVSVPPAAPTPAPKPQASQSRAPKAR